MSDEQLERVGKDVSLGQFALTHRDAQEEERCQTTKRGWSQVVARWESLWERWKTNKRIKKQGKVDDRYRSCKPGKHTSMWEIIGQDPNLTFENFSEVNKEWAELHYFAKGFTVGPHK